MSKDESSINLRATLYFPRADILIIIFLENKIKGGRSLKILTFQIFFLNSWICYTNYREMSDKENDMTDSNHDSQVKF